MPTFLTRLRSLRRSRPNSTSNPPIKSIATDVARNEKRDAHTAVEDDASPESPSRNVELDSKIYPDLSALFASVEEALKSHERVAEAQNEVHLYDDSDSENDYGDEQVRDAQRLAHSTNDSALYASFGSGLGTGWSTFGQDDSPCPQVPQRTHIVSSRDNNRNNNGRVIAANFRPSSTTDAVLSWSPKPVESLESLRPTNFSYSSPALYPSPEIQQQNTQTSVYYSPSPGTFGYPTPPHFDPVDFPSFPAPAFHSTPKTSASSRTRSLPKRSPRTSGRSRIPRLISNNSRMKRTKSDLPRTSRRRTSTHAIGALEQKLASIRSSTSVSKIPVRRKSAEWNSRAATAGVVADPKQTTEFGWPAEVSREILRLSLGEDLMLHSHSHGQDAPTTPAATTPVSQLVGMRDTQNRDANLKRGAPRVSHGHKLNERLIIRPSISEHRLSSAHLYQSTVPPSSSTSSAPGRSDGTQTTATQVSSTPSAPSVAAPKNSRSQSSGDNALDTNKSDSEMGATGVAAHHKRSESENKIDWESAELQEFISREESGGDLSGDALRRPSTPMKKSESESTYQTAGSSSYLHAPSLSVIAPTPRSSPGGSRHNSGASGALPEATYGLQVPTPPPQTAKSKGKRKAEESEDGSPSPPDVRAPQNKKVEDLAADEPRRDSNVSRAPSSFQSFQSQKSRKRVRLSSPMATPDHSRPGSTVPHHLGSVSSRGSTRSAVPHSDSKVVPPRSVSRASRTSRAMSAGPSGSSSIAFPGRRSLSQASIPISAIVTPRAPSVDRLSSFHMRDPRRPPPQREIGWTLRFPSFDDRGSPFAAWAFWFGFLFPLLWWLASFWRIPQTRMVGTDTEKAVVVDDPFYEREARAWRLRCRVASALFFVTYVPVIVLLAVFV
ncbi:hypothetical protein ACEPAI_8976 [Sanghuangporus weigelae]